HPAYVFARRRIGAWDWDRGRVAGRDSRSANAGRSTLWRAALRRRDAAWRRRVSGSGRLIGDLVASQTRRSPKSHVLPERELRIAHPGWQKEDGWSELRLPKLSGLSHTYLYGGLSPLF